MEQLALHSAQVIRERMASGPYRLLGFSFGAKLAVETAWVLIAQGEEVSHLILLDPPAAKRHWADRIKLAYQAFISGHAAAARKETGISHHRSIAWPAPPAS